MSVDVRHIQVLSVALRNQIAAGEVVERPAAALKELLENSLDAGAKQIDIELENGGQSLIRVQDDGIGIAKDELALALTRHATSKISQVTDLESISTLGFRGEALPSIAQVSKFRLVSCKNKEAYEIQVDFGESREIRPAALPVGTLVEVRDLFSNIPARLKFLKTSATETKRAQEIVHRLALANLDVGFSLKLGGREVLRLVKNQSLSVRLANFWPSDVIKSLRPFSLERNGIEVHGLTSIPQVTQLRSNRILLFVNGRAITDKKIMAAVREAYKGKLTSRDYPQVVLFLKIDPREVDVNVHPAKSEVRFLHESLIFTSCVQALRRTLDSLSLTPEEPEPDQPKKPSPDSEGSSLGKEEPFTPRRPGFWGNLDDPDFWRKPEEDHDKEPEGSWKITKNPNDAEDHNLADKPPILNDPKPNDEPHTPENTPTRKSEPSGKIRNLTYLGQISATYLLFRDLQDELVIIDQHAAHERILYERMRKEAKENLGQVLMVPFELNLHPVEAERFHGQVDNLKKMGFSFNLQGNSLSCLAIPPMFTLALAKSFLQDCLNGSLEDNDDMLKSMACHGAIKAGQHLTWDEVEGLLEQWMSTPNREFCPHGRPTILRFNTEWFEKAFKRKQ
ncbi:MAG: DNA mismatch repair endonuclease MutL [Desulfovibrionaceae bacterium]|nr:DNA mismatch repair endonuclease MutL [Desulfovibrionaceae bacterium]